MDDLAVRRGVDDLIAAYVDCIDEDRLEDWPDFFVEQCRYVITSRLSHEAGLPHGVVYAASRGMLVDRVTALRPTSSSRIAIATSSARSASSMSTRRSRRHIRISLPCESC